MNMILKNISKLFEGLGTELTSYTIARAKWSLAIMYIVAVLFIISILTFLTYQIYVGTLKDNLDYNLITLLYGTNAGEAFVQASAEYLLRILITIDVFITIAIIIFGYYFASRTLRPIDTIFTIQKQFTQDVAHELRTPLSVIQTAIETLPDASLSAQEVIELKKDLLEETRNLIALTNNLLLLSQQEDTTMATTTPSMAKYDLKKICIEEIQKIKPYAQKKNITVQSNFSSSAYINTNADTLREILKNLLKNAVDYTQEDGCISVSTKTNKKNVQISITDTGVGIPRADQEKIFNRFYKSPYNQKLSKGSGLGLAIVHSAVHRLGGTVTVQSTEGKGSTFTVTLPYTHT